ncbi:MAG: FtsW/RodA/SpoVE family cell cycle protein [Aeromicrobium sp.]|uniref:FtsW/RodA/SpoVE family cell cycle protein n=1 Tax=Aeromicrobium sp. TaxID=1871063 RepID=UPI0039E27E0C
MSDTTWVPRKRRGAELILTVMAVGIGVFAYCAVGLGVEGHVPAGAMGIAGSLIIAAITANLLIRRLAPYADPVLLPLVLCLNGIGLAMIYRIDLGMSEHRDEWSALAPNQLMWTALGLGAFALVLTVVRDHRRLQTMQYSFGLAAIVLLILPLVPGLGTAHLGAKIWIAVGPFSFQPGEAAKICLAIFFASYLAEKREVLALAGRRVVGIDLPRGRDLGPIIVGWLVSIGVLVLQRDLGSSLLFFGLFVVMLYIATERSGWLVVGCGLFVVGGWFGYQCFGHVRHRFDVWLHTFDDIDNNYQLVTALYGMAHGGMLGRGWGLGSPDLTPFAYSDFIATSLGEELGLAGLMAVLLVYGLIVERGLRISLTCRDAFGKLLAAGLAISLALQVFVVIGGVTRLIPLTGLTTPFLAQGGSSIVMNWAIIALLLRVSDQTRRPAPSVQPVTEDDATQVVKL